MLTDDSIVDPTLWTIADEVTRRMWDVLDEDSCPDVTHTRRLVYEACCKAQSESQKKILCYRNEHIKALHVLADAVAQVRAMVESRKLDTTEAIFGATFVEDELCRLWGVVR